MYKIISTVAAMTLVATSLVAAQSAEAKPFRDPVPGKGFSVAELYDSLPTNPVKFGSKLRQTGLNAETQAYLLEKDGADICGTAEMAEFCGFYGADTIRKVANYSHSADRISMRRNATGGIDPVKLALLEEGARRNLSASVGDKGLAEGEFQKLMPGEATAATMKKKKIKWLVDFRCVNHIQSGQTGWWYPFNMSKLTTCATVIDVRIAWWFLSVETGITSAHSTLWRHLGVGELGVWIPDGTERTVCASSKWNTMNSGPRCNTKDWMSKISAAYGIAFFQSPVPIDNYGTAERLTVPLFNTHINFQ